MRVNPLGRRRIDAARSERAKRAGIEAESELVPYGQEIVGAPFGSKARTSRRARGAKAALPAMVDNSALDWFPPIRSQGSVASCACFSSTYYQMTHMTAMVRGWNAKNGGNSYRFSPKWTYNLAYDQSGEAPSLLAAHCVMMDHGAATWADFPYDGDYTEWPLGADLWRRAIGFRIAQVGGVSDLDTDDGMLVLKQLLVNGFVLVFPTYIFSWQIRTIPDDPSTTDDDPRIGEQICRYVNGTQGAHGMTIVGYDDHIWCDVNENGSVDAGEKGALKVASSWGTGYGNGGYYWICYDALKAVSAVERGPSGGRVPAITDCTARWMTARASYVPKMVAVFRVNHGSRRQMSMRLGKSQTAQAAPSVTWKPYALTGDGGDLAFNGGTSPCDGEFALDLSDLAPDDGVQVRYYCGMSESSDGYEKGTIEEFKLVDAWGTVLAVATGVPLIIDGTTDYVHVDHLYDGGVPATVTVSAPDGGAAEAGADTGTFRFTRTGGTSGALAVNFTVGGSASSGIDYVLTAASRPCAGSVAIQAGSSSVEMNVVPLDDWAVEGEETVEVSLAEGAGYAPGAPQTAAVVIADDDVVRIVAETDSVEVVEGSEATFQVKLSADPQGNLSVNVARRSGDADIRIVGAPLALEFDSTNWDAYQTVELTAVEDADELNGTAVIRCSAPGAESREITATEIDTGRRGGACSSAAQAGAEGPFSGCVLPTAFLMLAVSLLRSRKRGRTAAAVDGQRP